MRRPWYETRRISPTKGILQPGTPAISPGLLPLSPVPSQGNNYVLFSSPNGPKQSNIFTGSMQETPWIEHGSVLSLSYSSGDRLGSSRSEIPLYWLRSLGLLAVVTSQDKYIPWSSLRRPSHTGLASLHHSAVELPSSDPIHQHFKKLPYFPVPLAFIPALALS